MPLSPTDRALIESLETTYYGKVNGDSSKLIQLLPVLESLTSVVVQAYLEEIRDRLPDVSVTNTDSVGDFTTPGTVSAGAKTIYFEVVSGSCVLSANSGSITLTQGKYLNLEFAGNSGHGAWSYTPSGTVRVIVSR